MDKSHYLEYLFKTREDLKDVRLAFKVASSVQELEWDDDYEYSTMLVRFSPSVPFGSTKDPVKTLHSFNKVLSRKGITTWDLRLQVRL